VYGSVPTCAGVCERFIRSLRRLVGCRLARVRKAPDKADMRKLVLLVFAACSSSSSSSSRSRPPSSSSPPGATHCYAGTGATTLIATGQVVDQFDAVARRTTDPAASQIHEEMAVGGSRPGRYKVDMVVTGSKLVMKEAGGAFEGDGDLVGPAWAWRSWTTRSRMPGGIEVTSTDTVQGDAILAEKTVVQNGAPLVRIIEKLAGVPCDDFDARAQKIAPQR
jgi:hypothetical protein